MSGRIHLLDPICANQIAAGEVVERPASVVKELVENALDAKSNQIVVEVSNAGFERIRVMDNGFGMTKDDACMSIQRHATSKVRTIDDLFSLDTFGFRGEALPSIASVSKMTLITRTIQNEEGTEILIEGGKIISVVPCGSSVGTTVIVEELFFNTPARRKFTKSPGTERAHIRETCLRLALAHPHVHLRLVMDERVVQDFLPEEEKTPRIRNAFPKNRLSHCVGNRHGVQLEAFLSAPEEAKTSPSDLHLFVNGRTVRDRALARAVAFGYGSVLPPGRYPSGVLFVEVNQADVDVNVHPQKTEIRFSDARKVYEIVTRELAAHLGASAWSRIPANDSPSRRSDLLHTQSSGEFSVHSFACNPTSSADSRLAAKAFGLPRFVASERPLIQTNLLDEAKPLPLSDTDLGFFSSLNVLGQAERLFIICAGSDGLYVIDQHAADERVRYAEFSKAYGERKIVRQKLLFPLTLDCSAQHVAFVSEESSALAEMGFEIDPIGDASVLVRAVPQLVSNIDPAILVQDVLVEQTKSGSRLFGDRIDTVFATMACHAAVRGGDLLSNEQCTSILRRLDQISDFSGHCPHGRPVLFQISYAELQRKLGR